jgi:hypothetical protein
MSQPDLESVSVPSVIQKKPQLNIYTMLLVMALVALIMACVFLLIELSYYEFAWQGIQAALSPALAEHGDSWLV